MSAGHVASPIRVPWGLRVLRKSCLRGPQEPVSHIACVNIVSGDRTDWIVAKRDSALEGACSRARNVERGDRAVRGAHETVIDVARVYVLSRDRPCRVDALA